MLTTTRLYSAGQDLGIEMAGSKTNKKGSISPLEMEFLEALLVLAGELATKTSTRGITSWLQRGWLRNGKNEYSFWLLNKKEFSRAEDSKEI